jgi:hypothetical protein
MGGEFEHLFAVEILVSSARLLKMKRAQIPAIIRTALNVLLTLSVLYGLWLLVTSFLGNLSENDRVDRVALAGVVPTTMVIIQRLIEYILKGRDGSS